MTHERRPFCTRLTDDERRALRAAADAEGTTPSAFVRRTELKAAGRPVPPTHRRRDALALNVARAIGRLGQIGNLANQVARRANVNALRPNEATTALERLSSELSELRASFVAVERGRSDA